MGRPPGAKNSTTTSGGTKNGPSKATLTGKAIATTSKVSLRNGGPSKSIGESTPAPSTGKGVGRGGSGSTAAPPLSSSGSTEKDKTPQDRSQANFPYDIRLGGFASLQNAAVNGTPRIKRLLMDECDFIMECRVCRNLFRSLPNFITHKINYCKKSFDSTWCLGLSNIIPTGDSSYNLQYEVDPELVLIQANAKLSSSEPSDIEPTRSISVAEMYNELSEASNKLKEKQSSETSNDNVVRLRLQPLKLPGSQGVCETTSGGVDSVIVQQTVICNDPSSCDTAVQRPREFSKKNDTAILGPDGKVLCTAPGDRVELVVKRLSAQIESIQNREAQKLAEMERNKIICEICRTVFDSDKALRQHKRESLDCGKIWAFKAPIHDKAKEIEDNDETEAKRMKLSNGETLPSNKSILETSQNACEQEESKEDSVQSTKRPIRRFIGRRTSHPANGLADKKRTLSPVKRIKLKYSKYDQAKHQEAGDLVAKTPTCTKCRKDFPTERDLMSHILQCTNPSRPEKPFTKPEERIRIAIWNDFSALKTNCPPNPLLKPEELAEANSCNSILSESHRQLTSLRLQHLAGPLPGLDPSPTSEVNNNKQYKPFPNGRKSSSSSDDVDKSAKKKISNGQRDEEGDSDITSHDSGVSSLCSSWKKSTGSSKKSKIKLSKSPSAAGSKELSSAGDIRGSNGGTSVVSQELEPMDSLKSNPNRKNNVSKVKLHRLLSSTSSSFNLRKITSRIRKSRRTQAPSSVKLKKTSTTTKAKS